MDMGALLGKVFWILEYSSNKEQALKKESIDTRIEKALYTY